MSEKVRTVEDKFKDYLNTNAHSLFVYVTVLTLIIFFREDISALAAYHLKDSESLKTIGILDKAVFLFLFVLVSSWIIIKKITGYVFSLKRFWIYTYFILVYFIFRLSDSFPENLKIAESCAIILPDLLVIIYAILAWANVRNIVELFEEYDEIKTPIGQHGFIADTPKKEQEEQNLWSQAYVESFVKNLCHTYTDDASFNVLLNSEWGTGKTSFINQVRKTFKDSYPEKYIWVDFNAWKSENAQHIVGDFFEQLEDELSKEHAGAKRAIQKYLHKIDSSSVGWLGAFISLFRNNSLKTSREHLDDILLSINKKIIIAVDDVDRLSKEEISEVLKLIRNTANFKDLFFIVACDKDYLNEAIKKINENNYEVYSRKIFQLELNLPKYYEHVFSEFTENLFLKNIDFIERDYIYINKHTLLKRIFEELNINDIRSIKIIYNSFILNYHIIGKEVNVLDLLILEIIRFKFPKIYNSLKTRNQILDKILSISDIIHFNEFNLIGERNKIKEDHEIISNNKNSKILFEILARGSFDLSRFAVRKSRFRYFSYSLNKNEKSIYTIKQLLLNKNDVDSKDELIKYINNNLENFSALDLEQFLNQELINKKELSDLLIAIVQENIQKNLANPKIGWLLLDYLSNSSSEGLTYLEQTNNPKESLWYNIVSLIYKRKHNLFGREIEIYENIISSYKELLPLLDRMQKRFFFQLIIQALEILFHFSEKQDGSYYRNLEFKNLYYQLLIYISETDFNIVFCYLFSEDYYIDKHHIDRVFNDKEMFKHYIIELSKLEFISQDLANRIISAYSLSVVIYFNDYLHKESKEYIRTRPHRIAY